MRCLPCKGLGSYFNEKEKKEASLLATVTSGIAYGVEKEQIIERLCKEFKLTNSAAEKKYEKYAVKMA